MPRPSLISRIHELKYEMRRARLSPSEMPRLVGEYNAKVLEACESYNCSKAELLRTIASDFGKWIRDEKMPPLEEPLP
jgi:hypothetical protein